MISRRVFCVSLLLPQPLLLAGRADTPVVVGFDTTAPGKPATGDGVAAPLARWGGLVGDGVRACTVDTPPDMVCRGGVGGAGQWGLWLENRRPAPVTVAADLLLRAGLWRVEAGLAGAVEVPMPLPVETRYWRMESLLQRETGVTRKTLTVPAGQVLVVRGFETGAAAQAAREAVFAACEKSQNAVMRERVVGPLRPVGEAIEALPALVRRGDRAAVSKRVHTALLATAKAQAVWQNWRDEAIAGGDAAFALLIAALSEVSCAAFNLVPSQTVVGADKVRVSLTNAGARTVPLIALGVGRREAGGAATRAGNLTVFRNIGPGRTVSEIFSPPDPKNAGGIVQFISDMGAATVPAQPDSPTPAP